MTQPQTERLHGLDAIRGFALLLGVVLHATMSFLPGPQVWLIADASRSVALSVAFFVIHIMRMTVFFLIAGFFGRMVLERIGVSGFIRNRLLRIGVPLVVAWPLVFAAIVAVLVATAPPGADEGSGLGLAVESFPLTHLWFLYLLLILYAAMLLLRGVIGRVAPVSLGRLADRVVRGVIQPWGPIVLAVPVAFALYRHPYWMMWFGIPTPDTGFVPNQAALVTYGVAFTLGWLIQRQATPLLARLQRWYALHLCVAIGATAYCLAATSLEPLLMPVPQGSRKLWFAVTYAVALWSWTFAIMGAGLRFLATPSPARRYLADASYWIYIVHLPLVMALQLLVADWSLPWPVKFFAVLATAMALLLLSYHFLVRPSFIGATLNGRRYPRASLTNPLSGSVTMRIALFTLLVPAVMAAQSPQVPAPIPLDSVLARHARAVGPIAAMNTRRATTRLTGLAPFEIPIVAEAMRPNLIRKEVTIQGAVQVTAYDGVDAWRIDPFVPGGTKPMDVPAAEFTDLLEEADFDGPLFRAAAKGHRIAYLPPSVVTVGARRVPVHSLRVTFKGGRETVIHIDATTWLETKRVQSRPVMGRETEMEITLSDYRLSSGIRVPFLTEITVKGMPTPIRLTFDKLEWNVALDRKRFGRSSAK